MYIWIIGVIFTILFIGCIFLDLLNAHKRGVSVFEYLKRKNDRS